MSRYRFLTIFLLIILCACSVNFLHAEEPATTTDSATITPRTVTPPVSRPRDTSPSLSKIAQTRLTNLAANMSNRMDAVASRLQNVNDRLNSRLNKMSEEGLDTNSARENLTAAQTKLNLAKTSLINIDSEVAAFTGSANPKENWASLKFTFLSIKDNLIASHKLILAAIESAKQATPKVQTDTAEESTISSSTDSN